MENPIMEKWWVEKELGLGTQGETECEEEGDNECIYSDPQIRIRTIQVVTFAGNQIKYNRLNAADDKGDDYDPNLTPPGPGLGSWLTVADQKVNNAALFYVARTLFLNPDFRVLLQGHANPTGVVNEDESLRIISEGRARSAEDYLVRAYALIINGLPTDWHDPHFPALWLPGADWDGPGGIYGGHWEGTLNAQGQRVLDLMDEARALLEPRMITEGYGGDMAFILPGGNGGVQGDYPLYNRRVNLVVYTIIYN